MKFINLLFYSVIIITYLLMQGCSTADHHEFFEAYEEAFKIKTNYITHRVQRDEFSIHVREFGKRTQQPTLAMMHGFPDSMHLYDWLIPELMDDRHIITFDFLGWGESDKPEHHRYDVASLRRDLGVVIANFGLEEVVLVLHDASGQPGIDWALDNAEKIAGLVLLNTYYSPMPTLRAPEAIELFSTPGLRRYLSIAATSLSDSLWIKRYNEQMAKFISTKELREPFQKILGHQSLKIRPAFYGLNRVLREEIEKRENKRPQLTDFKPPVRIIFGNDDPYLNGGVAEEFHKLFKNSEIFLIENGGHFVQVDKPKQVADLLRDFPSSD
ncbi:MAG: alpha/beta hydrolase [Candidatus Thiodiazotropha sp. (ex Dulcina madagascariensis)]|nr:alpha/beta hydrolase [Candidatus Thiodiazotropha sp. (ex Dulcina madagascariensis)]